MGRYFEGRWMLRFGIGIGVVVGLVSLLPLLATSRAPDRIVVLEARGMSFYLEGQSSPNPAIQVRAGEEVQFVLKNLDAGILHDFAVVELGLATETVRGPAEAAVTVRFPAEPTSLEYVCRPHSRLMRGRIDVR